MRPSSAGKRSSKDNLPQSTLKEETAMASTNTARMIHTYLSWRRKAPRATFGAKSATRDPC
jgi:hypothetical protein